MENITTATPPRAIELPEGYHLSHFREMLAFVGEVYSHCLRDDERDWLAGFDALPRPAQSLYVRLANRKGRVFRRAHLRYADVPDIAGALTTLERAGFAGALAEADFADALRVLSKDELFTLLADAGHEGVRQSWTRPRMIDAIGGHLGYADCFDGPARAALVTQRRIGPLRYMLFLYFGRIEESLTRFALRDLGIVRTNSFRADYEARFESREDATESYFYADHLARIEDAPPAVSEVSGWPVPGAVAAPLHDELMFGLGRSLERRGETGAARLLYERGGSAECGERAVRLAWAAGESDTVRARLEAMIENPASDSEALFAQDFLDRKFGGKRTSVITDMLRAGETIALDECHRDRPEHGALRHFERAGWQGYRAENAPWRTLFGLLFWEELYEGDSAGLHNEFERMPRSLTARTFHETNAGRIEARLSLLDDPATARAGLLKTLTRCFGVPNALFRWHRDIFATIDPLLKHAPDGALAHVMRQMARDYPARKDGFPDLILTREGALRLVEIKTENDSIRRNQLSQLTMLRQAGFDVAVNRVQWVLDPEQDYVVVDIETTGGRPPYHRITEIGAVRMRGGRIVDRWQSLINPERPIPATITRLTGIDNAMVADAPRFAEIADSFAAFMQDAIFVAHNVRFDYGFIAAEYERLEQRFRHPQLCTCQSMRQLFKGLPSYGLAKLCAHFDIPLDSHHRAMCDAEAAAQLLVMINERRMERTQEAESVAAGS